MNAADQIKSFDFAKALASVGSIVKGYFPAASINFSPWREDPFTKLWFEEESLDLAFHFPGWSSHMQCRSLLIQLRVTNDHSKDLPHLLGVIIRGITFNGESWKFATIGDWQATGSHLPEPFVIKQLHAICHDLFILFP